MKRNPDAIPQNESEEQSREQSLTVVALMRREGLSLQEAANRVGIDPRTVHRYVGSELRQDGPGGRYVATPYDHMPRTLHFITLAGTVPITVKDSRTATRIAEHTNAVKAYTHGGDSRALETFRGESFEVDGVRYDFLTDLEAISILADAGELAIDRLYRGVQ